MIHDFSDFPEALRSFALAQICARSILFYDESTLTVQEVPNANEIRKNLIKEDSYGSWRWWVGFSTGVESLVKATFLNNKISLLKKNNHLEKGLGGQNQLATTDAVNVYSAISNTQLTSTKNPWLESEFRRLNINHPYEINSGTLGAYVNSLGRLEAVGRVSPTDSIFLKDALVVLSDMRRNVDAHVFLKTQVAGSINGDLSKVYVPAINILLAAY